MNKFNIMITIKKELRSIFRDKKTMIMIFCFPFIISLFIFFFGYMEDTLMGTEDTSYNIGIDYELNSIEKTFLDEFNLEPIFYSSISEMKSAYDEGEIDAYISYDGSSKLYIIYSDDMMNSMASTYASYYLDSYNAYLGDLYLKSEDIDPEIVYSNIKYELKTTDGEELNTSGMMIEMVLDIAFTYIIMAIALATVNMATSAIATEKENGTLETILTLPVNTKELITGKYIATVIIGMFSSVIGFILTIVSFTIATNMFEIYEGFSINATTVIFGLTICIVASLLIGALAIVITSSAKSFKEAQAKGNYLQYLCIVPVFLSFLELKITKIFYMIPILGHTTILMDLYLGDLKYINLFICILSTLIYSSVLIFYLFKKFKSEKILFGV